MAPTNSTSDPPRATWRALYPIRSRIGWKSDGARMHYLDERPGRDRSSGRCQTLLFVHGNPTWSFHWRALIRPLRSQYRCVAPDHFGCGLSDKPRGLLHARRITSTIWRHSSSGSICEHVTLVAQDWGGAIGLGAMLRMPERLERIVLFNTGAFPPPYIPWRIRACRIPLLGRLAVQGGGPVQPRRAAHDARPPSAARPGGRRRISRTLRLWANRRAVYGFVKDIPSGPDRSDLASCSPTSNVACRRSPIGRRSWSGACATGASAPIAWSASHAPGRRPKSTASPTSVTGFWKTRRKKPCRSWTIPAQQISIATERTEITVESASCLPLRSLCLCGSRTTHVLNPTAFASPRPSTSSAPPTSSPTTASANGCTATTTAWRRKSSDRSTKTISSSIFSPSATQLREITAKLDHYVLLPTEHRELGRQEEGDEVTATFEEPPLGLSARRLPTVAGRQHDGRAVGRLHRPAAQAGARIPLRPRRAPLPRRARRVRRPARDLGMAARPSGRQFSGGISPR